MAMPLKRAPSIRQMQAWRFMMARGFSFDTMYFDEITDNVVYTRNETRFYIDRNGEIWKDEEVPVTRYEMQRKFVSDWREEGYMSGHRNAMA